mmetsp:Transcript_30342/g.26887  ORF Transcript_30342/g.26887 Transcript_30342/m.26887 type:complete len:102 (+) Transcript_30342:976-1281(+)
MCIQDDYEAWHFHDEKSHCAKPLIMSKDQIGEDKIIDIFFDDHCNFEEECIVDVIDLNTKEKIEYKDHIDKYTVKALSLKAIQDQDYFTDKMGQLLKLHKL